MLKNNTIQQLNDIGTVGAYRFSDVVRWGREDTEIMGKSLSELYVEQTAYNELDKRSWFFKRPEIRTESTALKYSGRFEIVDGKEFLVIQELHHDNTRIKIVGEEDDIKNISRVNKIHSGMTDKEFERANQDIRDELNRIGNYHGRFNIGPEIVDEYGVKVSTLDDYDNFEYEIQDMSQGEIYKEYHKEMIERRNDRTLEYLQKKLDKYERDVFGHQYKVVALLIKHSNIKDILNQYEYNEGSKLYDEMENISKSVEISMSNLWLMWKTLKIPQIKEAIKEIE